MPYNQTAVRFVTVGLLLGLVLSSIEQTVVSTAMPTVIKQLGGLSLYSWVFSVYMLTSTATMPLYGKLADLYGRRKIYLTGLLLFLIGSVLCGLSGSIAELIAYRGIQGLGAGALMPVAFTIVGDLFPPERRGKFMGLFSAAFILSSIAGPALGGVLVQYWSWRSIFYLNLPIGIPAFFMIAFALKENVGSEKRRVDWLGAITLTLSVVSILLALVLGSHPQETGAYPGWGSAPIIGLFTAGVMLLGLFIWIESKAMEPIIPLHLFRIRTIAFSNISGFFVSAAIFGAIAYIPLFAQGVIGVSPSVAGYTLTPLMLASAVTSTVGGRLMSRFSFRTILVSSLILMAAGYYLLSRMTAETSAMQIVLSMIVTGLGMGAVFPTLGTAAQSSVDWGSRGVATSTNQFFRSIGGTIGVSVLGSVMADRMTAGLMRLNAQGAFLAAGSWDPQPLLDPNARAVLPAEAVKSFQNVFSDALGLVFLVGMLFVVLSLVSTLFIGSARLVKASKS